jgi:putative DNA primase/helicase
MRKHLQYMPMTNEAYYVNIHSNVFTNETSDYLVIVKETRIQRLEAHELIAEVCTEDFYIRICSKTISLQIAHMKYKKRVVEGYQPKIKFYNKCRAFTAKNLLKKIMKNIISYHNKKQSKDYKNREQNEAEAAMLKILQKIELVNFKEIALLKGHAESLKTSDIIVIGIEVLNDLALNCGSGLCNIANKPYVYTGSYWANVSQQYMERFFTNAFGLMGVSEITARSVVFKEKVYKQFLSSTCVEQNAKKSECILVNLNNGTYEIRNGVGKLRPHSIRDFLTYKLSFNYDPSATAVMFFKFLDEVLPDKRVQLLIAQYLGSIFITRDYMKLEKILVALGIGSNGKSVLFEIILTLLGKENVTSFSVEELTTKEYYRVQIAGKLLNYSSEISTSVNSSLLKAMASGEPIPARALYQTPIMIYDYAKLMFNANELPITSDTSDGYFRRFLIVEFNQQIPEDKQDKMLAKKIIASELPGVFNWLLMGLSSLIENGGFSIPESVNQSVLRYRREIDNISNFIEEEQWKPCEHEIISLQCIYLEYVAYCKDNGLKYKSKIEMRKALEKHKFIIKRTSAGNVVYAKKLLVP